MSRVDAVRIAVEKARELGHSLEGAVLASDAFFPFADGPALALEAGVAAVIQPGGSKRDDEVVAAVTAAGGGDGLHRPPALPALTATFGAGETRGSPVSEKPADGARIAFATGRRGHQGGRRSLERGTNSL